MNFTSHSAIGLAIGRVAPNVPAAFVAGIVLHYVADLIPHVDLGSFDLTESKQIFKRGEILSLALGDIGTGLFVIMYSSLTHFSWITLAAVAGSVLPDILELPFWDKYLIKLPVFKQLARIHSILHFTIKKKSLIWLGLLTQLIVIFLALYYGKFFDPTTVMVVSALAIIMSAWFMAVTSKKLVG